MSNPNFSYCVECDRTAERECDNCHTDLCKNCYYPLGLCVPCLEDDDLALHLEDEGTEEDYEYDRDKSEEV